MKATMPRLNANVRYIAWRSRCKLHRAKQLHVGVQGAQEGRHRAGKQQCDPQVLRHMMASSEYVADGALRT